jgi:sugar phosphate isomerase/epimerase
MKLSFSTLSCPEWTFDQILEAGKKYGYDGIEFRGLREQIDILQAPEFQPAALAETRHRLEDAGLQAACLSSSVSVVASVASEATRKEAVAHAERYLDAAKALGAPCIRIFCGDIPSTMLRDAAVELAAQSLREMGDFAEARGVKVAIETHDAFIRTDQLMDLVRAARHPAVGVLWDIHHPYRYFAETIEQSMRHLGKKIFACHVKDSVMAPEGEHYTYVLLGRGDVPIQPAIKALQRAGYDGYLSLEWEKRWVAELEAPEEVIPQYIAQMKALMGESKV